MPLALLLLSILLTLAWVPILIRFFRSWRNRHNPISLALCNIILLIIYININLLNVYLLVGNPRWTALALLGISTLVCINFHFCVYWADKKFKDSRQQ